MSGQPNEAERRLYDLGIEIRVLEGIEEREGRGFCEPALTELRRERGELLEYLKAGVKV